MPARVRVKEPVVVRSPGGGGMVALKADAVYDEDDPLVVEYPWAFDFGENTPAAHGRRGRSRGGVEQATAAPGEQRTL